MTPAPSIKEALEQIVAKVTIDPGDDTVHPDIGHVLARGFHAMGWANPQAASDRASHVVPVSLDPIVSDCEKQDKGTLVDQISADEFLRDASGDNVNCGKPQPSDRTADVTALLTECRKFIAYAACYDDDVQSHKQRDDLVSRIDAFTVGRR